MSKVPHSHAHAQLRKTSGRRAATPPGATDPGMAPDSVVAPIPPADSPPPTIALSAEGLESLTLAAHDFHADGLAERLAVFQDASVVHADITALPTFPPATRVTAIAHLGTLPLCRYIADGGAAQREPLDALLPLLAVRCSTIAERADTVHVIAEILAVRHRDQLATMAKSVVRGLKGRGIGDVSATELIKLAERLVKQFYGDGHASTGSSGITVRSVLSDAPVTETAMIPAGWKVTPSQMIGPGNVEVYAPVVITERGSDDRRRAETLTLAWRVADQWHITVVDRADVADAAKIVKLAALGFPVTSVIAKGVVSYLAAYEALNREALPAVRVSARLGWQGERDGFLVGRNYHTDRPTDHPYATVTFRGACDGDEQIASGYYASGDLDGWLAAIEPVGRYSVPLFAFYAGFAATVAPIVGAPNFVVSFAGQTSGGKTTTLRIIASCWGCPDEQSSRSLINNWNSTPVFRDRLAAISGHVPLLLDETQHIHDPTWITRLIYGITQGRAKGRGTVGGIDTQSPIETILFVTGETPITDLSQDGGTRARVLEFWGAPFTDQPGSADDVHAINSGIRSHFGNAGPAFVRYLMAGRDNWTQWRECYADRERRYCEQAAGNPVAGRMAPYLALIELTAELVHHTIPLPWDQCNPVDRVYAMLTAETGEADRAAAAMRHVIDWAAGNSAQFTSGIGPKPDHVPHQGLAGKLCVSERGDWGVLAFIPARLRQILADGGFHADAVIRLWIDRGWVETDGSHRSAKVIRYHGSPVRMIHLSAVAIADVLVLATGPPLANAERST